MAPTPLRIALLAGVLALAAACGGADVPTAPDGGPRKEINDWGRWGVEGFYFLPGTPPGGFPDATFDANVQPTVTLCRMTGSACGATLASWTRTSGSYGRTVSVSTAGRSYNVTWPTASTGVSTGQIYRVSVIAAGRTLGWQDVQIVASTTAGAALDTSQVKWVVRNNNYAISFRINQGIASSISLSVPSLSMDVADGKGVSATLLDLRGNAMSTVEVGWQVEDLTPGSGPVASLDGTTVVGGRPGSALLWAWYRDLSVSIPVTVSDNRWSWTQMATPDTEQNRALWGTSATNVYAANNTGILRWNGSTWAHVTQTRWRTMHDVWGTAANNVWAVGDNGLILRYNGTTWTAERFNGTAVVPFDLASWASPPGPRVKLRRVTAIPGSGLVAVVGDGGVVLTWDGAAWAVYDVGDDDAITGVWGTGYTNMYITRGDGRLQRFDGSNLSTVTVVTSSGAMHAVWGTSASNVYAVGDGGMVWRYNGTTWSRVRLPTRAALYAVYGTSANNVFVAGSEGALYRYNGTAWVPERAAGVNAQNYGFWAAPTGETFVAGAGGLISRR